MMFFSILPLATTFFFLGRVRAANDWSVPCLEGQCSYDLKNDTASGSLQISGSSNAISDLTTAAGWTILECNSAQINQDIRVVCTGNTDDCNHLYSGGAVNTLVRLPESCGAMPFARVAKEWTHENQTIPSQVQATIQKREGSSTAPTVRGIRLDTNFAAIDPAQNGNVTMFIQGSNAAGENGNFTVTPVSQRRGLIGDIASDIKAAVDDALDSFQFNLNKSTAHTIDFDKSVTLFDQSINCPASGKLPDIKGEVKVAVEPKAHAVVGFGVVAAGTVVPPKITDFGLYASLDGSLNGTLTVDASASTTLDSGKIQIFQVGIPGLDFPGILSIGPSFVVNAQGIATLDTDLKLGVNLAYNVNNAKLFFPPGSKKSSGDFSPANTDLTLAATPNAAASGSVEAHIIPSLQFGLDALDGLAKATVNLDLDTSAKLTLSLKAGASASVSSNSSSNNSSSNRIHSSQSTKSSTSSSHQSSSTTSYKDSYQNASNNSSKDYKSGSTSNAYKSTSTSSAKQSGSTNSSSYATSSSPNYSKNYARTYNDSSNAYNPSHSSTSTSPHSSSSSSSKSGASTYSQSGSSSYDYSKSSSNSSSTSHGNNYSSSSNSTSNSSNSSESLDTSFNGCVDLSVGLAVTAGADASFLSLFDKSTSVTLFQKDFDLFNKCFGSGSNKKRWPGAFPSFPSRRHPRDVLARRALKCSTSATSDLTSIVDDVINAKNIIAKAK